MIDFSKIRVYIFDLQQTLLNDFEAHLEAHREILEESGVDDVTVALEEVKRLWGMSVFDVYRQIFGEKFSDEQIQGLVYKRDEKYIEIFSKSEPTLCPGVREILEYVKSQNIPIAVVSGIRRNLLERGLKNAKLDSYVDFMLGADDVEKSKPHPEPFLKVSTHFGIEPEYCVAIGDSFLDVEGAKNAGMTAIGVLTGFTKKETLHESGTDLVVNDLIELLSILKHNHETEKRLI